MAFEELLETHNQGDVAVVKSLLESEGIPFFVQGEQFSILRPFAGAARVMVPKERLEEARELIGGLRFVRGPGSSKSSKGDEAALDD
jgi:hypothetical protein